MGADYAYFLDLAHEIQPPQAGILSRTIYQDDRVKAVLFGLAAGEELSEHTASRPALLYFVQGQATLGLGDDQQPAQSGAWVHLSAQLKHSIQARTPVVFLLVLLK